MKQADYLLKIKEKHGFKSWNQLADYLNVSKSAMSQWRSEVSNFDAEHARVVAEELNIDPKRVAADIMAAKAKDAKTRKFWEAAAYFAALPLMQVSDQVYSVIEKVCILCKIPRIRFL